MMLAKVVNIAHVSCRTDSYVTSFYLLVHFRGTYLEFNHLDTQHTCVMCGRGRCSSLVEYHPELGFVEGSNPYRNNKFVNFTLVVARWQ